jgi:hypothetical protein
MDSLGREPQESDNSETESRGAATDASEPKAKHYSSLTVCFFSWPRKNDGARAWAT